jgi:carbonic anhydrase
MRMAASCRSKSVLHIVRAKQAAQAQFMTNFENLIERNVAFAKTDAKSKVPVIPFIPNRQAYIITCIDPRVDPTDILGLELGDAIVGRNVGGRLTPAMLRDIAWISYLHEVKTPDAGWFDLVIIHHTDCGSGFFADDDLRHEFANRGFDDGELEALAVLHPADTVAADVEKVLAYPNLSPVVRVSGYVYDIETGLLTRVVAPRSRSEVVEESPDHLDNETSNLG